MSKNIIFYFSGTGNCLHVAKKIAATIGECDIRLMGNKNRVLLDQSYESIGFVYPTYFQGVPVAVEKFVSSIDFSKQNTAYFYAVTTYGAHAGNALSQMSYLLQKQGATLNYGEKLMMFSNYIVLYKMSSQVREKSEEAERDLKPILEAILSKETNTDNIQRMNVLLSKYYNWRAKQIPTMDRKFNVSSSCISCGICRDICPVQNITLKDGKPCFHHHCEQCMACLQYCPKQAINYKNITQSRGRYTNPNIPSSELIKNNAIH